MKLSYYPGCSLHSTAAEYDASTRQVFNRIGIELQEVEDWNCCGASSGHAAGSEFLHHSLPLRNLALAERTGMDVVIPCAACYQNLKTAETLVRQGKMDEEAAAIKGITGYGYAGKVKSRHVLDILAQKDLLKTLAGKITSPLNGLPVACYYGCYLTRPADMVAFEDPEQPTSMDRILQVAGAKPVEWSYKTDCCGGSLALTKTDVVINKISDLITTAREAGAKAIVTACPMCMSNLDTRQPELVALKPDMETMPIYYVTELLAVAMGIGQVQDWFSKHLIDPAGLLQNRS